MHGRRVAICLAGRGEVHSDAERALVGLAATSSSVTRYERWAMVSMNVWIGPLVAALSNAARRGANGACALSPRMRAVSVRWSSLMSVMVVMFPFLL